MLKYPVLWQAQWQWVNTKSQCRRSTLFLVINIQTFFRMKSPQRWWPLTVTSAWRHWSRRQWSSGSSLYSLWSKWEIFRIWEENYSFIVEINYWLDLSLTNLVEDFNSLDLTETGVFLVSGWPAEPFLPLDNVGLLNCFKSQFSGWLIFIRPFLSK